MQKLVIALSTLLISGCAIFDDPTRAGIGDDGQLYYQGALRASANETVMNAYRAASEKPRVLRITSGGGNVHLGMDLGEWVYTNGLDVHVVKGCASSCANYIFTAGRNKLLDPDSVLFWHGGAYQRSLKKVAGNETSLQEWRRREDEFFKGIGVDGRITVCGQAAQLDRNKSRDKPYMGFDYSLEDMVRFGVAGITLVEGNWAWRQHHPRNEVLRVAVIGTGHDLRCAGSDET